MISIREILWCILGALLFILIGEESFSDPLPMQAVAPQYDGKKIIETAEHELGVFKQPGQDDRRVKQYCTETMQNDDVYLQDGWCSAFVSWILKQDGYKYSPNNTDFGWMFVVHRVPSPQFGDIAVLDGHIAFYIGQKVNGEGEHVVGLLGGNQDYQVCVMWVPENDIEYYCEADVANPDWKPEKHIQNGGAGSLNVFDDHIKWTYPSVHRTSGNHPL